MSKKLTKRKFSKKHIKHLKESRQGRIYSEKTREKMKREAMRELRKRRKYAKEQCQIN